MKVNSSHDTAASLLNSAISRDKFQAYFQASLATAKEKLAQNSTQQTLKPDAMSAARKELEDYIKKGPIGHMRDKILEQLGLTEEDIAKMSPEQRDTVEKTIAARMKEMLLAGTGIDTKGIQAQLINTALPAAAVSAAKETSSL